MTIPELVGSKEQSFSSVGSQLWIRAFGDHPDILDIEKDDPSSEVYASRYQKLYDESNTNPAMGIRMSEALQRHLEARNYSTKYQEEVLKYLRYKRRRSVDKQWRARTKAARSVDAGDVESEQPVAHTRKQRCKSAKEKEYCGQRFAARLEANGIPSGLSPQEVEVRSRSFIEKYYEGDKKVAARDMTYYMKMNRMNAEDIREAKVTRSDYNHKTTWNKVHGPRQYKGKEWQTSSQSFVPLDHSQRRGKEVVYSSAEQPIHSSHRHAKATFAFPFSLPETNEPARCDAHSCIPIPDQCSRATAPSTYFPGSSTTSPLDSAFPLYEDLHQILHGIPVRTKSGHTTDTTHTSHTITYPDFQDPSSSFGARS
ncbi:hypothetical protein CBS101457_003121 [Exobasidium rhododendri]|nr:hypothetical protein CBS101457_003121 [Exobasidium rhododendri]